MSGARRVTRAAIVAVGSEMLGTTRIDTNSLFLTEQLNAIGVDVVAKAVVGDDRPECAHVVRTLASRVDLLVLSGGLGPTDDDVTREVVAEVFERPLAEDPDITERLRARYIARGYAGPMPENNRRQAMVPRDAEVIPNANGSAPGLWLELDGLVVLLLPGPPRELKPMVRALRPRLAERTDGASLVRRVLKVTARIESQADEALQPLYRRWNAQPVPVGATILATLGQIELHLSARHASPAIAAAVLDEAVAEVLDVLGADVFSVDGASLEMVVGSLLVERGLSVSSAESCTGGLLTSRLTDVEGSSRYVRGAVVAYANDVKQVQLGVPERLLSAHGAVSEPVAEAMAGGVRQRLGTDVGVGITGIAGPGGGTPDKPVGTVAVAVAAPGETRVRLFRFHGEREQVKFQASQAGLDMIRRVLLGLPSRPSVGPGGVQTDAPSGSASR